ncbi:MAG TPA: DUF5615 family PIN-like protein [Bradyrhizobium sp.]
MKLLFDQNLSFRLCQTIANLFPDSNHVGSLGLSEVADRELWALLRPTASRSYRRMLILPTWLLCWALRPR